MADFGIGDPNDAEATSTTGAKSAVSLLKGIYTKIASIATGSPLSLGQKTMANSGPVVIASDQTPIETYIKGSVGGALAWVGAALDGDGASTPTLWVKAQENYFNGTTYDRQRNNYETTVLDSAARTSSVNSADQTNYNARGIIVTIDITAASGSPSLVVTVAGKSIRANAYRSILASAALTGVGRTVLRVYPGLTASANVVANDILERIWRIEVAAGTADSVTYSVSANYVI